MYKAEAVIIDAGLYLGGSQADAGVVLILAGDEAGAVYPTTELAGVGALDESVTGEITRIDYTVNEADFSSGMINGDREKISTGGGEGVVVGGSFAWPTLENEEKVFDTSVKAGFGGGVFPVSIGYNAGNFKVYKNQK